MSNPKRGPKAMQILGMLCLGGLLAGIVLLVSPFVINGGILFWASDGTKQSDAAWGLIGAITSVTLGLLLMVGCGVLAITVLLGAGIASIRSENQGSIPGESMSQCNNK